MHPGPRALASGAGAAAAPPARRVLFVRGRRLDEQLEILARPGVDDGHGPRGAGLVAAEQPGDLVERALGRAQTDALEPRRPGRAQGLQPLERQREVSAAFGRDERVDLVDDDRLDSGQRGPRRRREHEVERLGRRDEDVGRSSRHPRAILRRRVAGAHVDRRYMERQALVTSLGGDARDGYAQVALDVDRERLQRRYIEYPRARLLAARRLAHEAIDRHEERRQRLAGAGRREQQRRVAARDRRPAELLRPGGLAEPRAEPGGYRGMELGERGHSLAA